MRRFAAAVLFAPVALNPKLSFSLQSPHFFPNFVLPLLCFRRDLLSRKIEPRVSFFFFLFVIILYLYEAILLRENLISRREFFIFCYNRSIMFGRVSRRCVFFEEFVFGRNVLGGRTTVSCI